MREIIGKLITLLFIMVVGTVLIWMGAVMLFDRCPLGLLGIGGGGICYWLGAGGVLSILDSDL
jgi:hypothetical protein